MNDILAFKNEVKRMSDEQLNSIYETLKKVVNKHSKEYMNIDAVLEMLKQKNLKLLTKRQKLEQDLYQCKFGSPYKYNLNSDMLANAKKQMIQEKCEQYQKELDLCNRKISFLEEKILELNAYKMENKTFKDYMLDNSPTRKKTLLKLSVCEQEIRYRQKKSQIEQNEKSH
mgnify:FL=1